MRNLKLTIRYDGTDFFGWQTQPGQRTVQETLETAIAEITREERVRVNCSGRTDAGVHAVGQVANVYTATQADLRDAAEGGQREAAGRRVRARTGRGAAELRRQQGRGAEDVPLRHPGRPHSGPVPAEVRLVRAAVARRRGDGPGERGAWSAGTTSAASRRSGRTA